MSKFDELHEAYVAARKVFFARRDATVELATGIFEGLGNYLGCPRVALHFLSRTGGASLGRAHKADEAVWLGADDLWHFNIGLDLSDVQAGARKETARQTAILEMLAQPAGDGFSVGLKGWDERFSLPKAADSAEHAAFYEFVFQRVINSYQQAGQRFFESLIDSKRVIGG